MRLKVKPEDFIVREATSLRIRKQPAPHRVYLLEKRDWNTADALMRIARDKRVPYQRFGYGGKKDRHAHTFQYITVSHSADLSLTEKGYALRHLGYSQEPMSPSHVLLNHFELTLREMSGREIEQLQDGAERVRAHGFANYFDDQRFGNLDRELGSVAEQMAQGHWESALRTALTAIYPEEKREAKERKRALRECWGDWEACGILARTAFEQRSFDMLRKGTGNYREALATASAEAIGLWISTFQSVLWNEMLRRLLVRRGWVRAEHSGAAGPYLFQTDDAKLDGVMLPVPGRGMRFPDQESGQILEDILAGRRLVPAALERELLPGRWLKAHPRSAVVVPQGLTLEPPEPDELYPGTSKLRLRFSLPRGCYATMVIKCMVT